MGAGLKRPAQLDLMGIMKVFFEPQLIALGLSSSQIENQTPEELKQSLERVNDAIQNPSSFGKLRLTMAAEMGWIIAASNANSNVEEVTILPLLLERKKLILERLGNLHINGEATEAQKASVVAQEEAEQKAKLVVAELRARAEIDMKKAKARSEIWQAFLARESIASIAGGLLLILIVIILFIGMIAKLTIPDIITNSFLLILGYFFGQATGKALTPTKGDKVKQESDVPTQS